MCVIARKQAHGRILQLQEGMTCGGQEESFKEEVFRHDQAQSGWHGLRQANTFIQSGNDMKVTQQMKSPERERRELGIVTKVKQKCQLATEFLFCPTNGTCNKL